MKSNETFTIESAQKRLALTCCVNETQAARGDDAVYALEHAKASPTEENLAKLNQAMRALLAEFGVDFGKDVHCHRCGNDWSIDDVAGGFCPKCPNHRDEHASLSVN